MTTAVPPRKPSASTTTIKLEFVGGAKVAASGIREVPVKMNRHERRKAAAKKR